MQSACATCQAGRQGGVSVCGEAAPMRARSAERKGRAGGSCSACWCWLLPALGTFAPNACALWIVAALQVQAASASSVEHCVPLLNTRTQWHMIVRAPVKSGHLVWTAAGCGRAIVVRRSGKSWGWHIGAHVRGPEPSDSEAVSAVSNPNY